MRFQFTRQFTRHPPATETYEERFWAKVLCDLLTRCWLWTGCCDRIGYGRATGRPGGQRLPKAARMAWELTYGNHPCMRGPMLPHICVLHRCDNPPCVNPSHLFLGTKKDNTLDMVRNGRHVGNNKNRKWTDDEVRLIRTAVASGTSQAELGRRLGVSPAHISRIVRRVRYRSIV